MRSKKFLASVMTAIVVLSCTCGCSEGTQKFEAYTVVEYATPEEEAVGKRKDILKEEKRKDKTVIVNGIKYTGKYYCKLPNSTDFYNNNYQYIGENCQLQIEAKTGKLRDLIVVKNEDTEDIPAEAAYCRKLADEIAEDFIALNEYEVKELRCYNGHMGHRYKYFKSINGYEVADGVEILFFCNGQLRHLALDMPGSFDNVKNVKIDENKLKDALEDKVSEITQKTYGSYEWIEYDVISVLLMRTEYNQCALRYRLDVKGESNKAPFLNTVELYVIVDHEKYNPFKT